MDLFGFMQGTLDLYNFKWISTKDTGFMRIYMDLLKGGGFIMRIYLDLSQDDVFIWICMDLCKENGFMRIYTDLYEGRWVIWI